MTNTLTENKLTPRFIKMDSHPGLRLSDNQRKVIQSKYLRENVSVEAWLGGVAKNIALAELLYHPSSLEWNLFDGVRVSKKEVLTNSNPTKLWLFHTGLSSASERDFNFRRFMDNCYKAFDNHQVARQLVEDYQQKFYDLLSSWRFLPNSPALMNAGRELQQLSACYVLPIEDSMEGITKALQAQALIHKSGGGTGFSFEQLRPAGDPVKSTEGVASGVVSFIQVFDKMTEVVKQGGNRRGANMGVLPYWHPEIMEFIKVKSRPGVLENFNISVCVDEKFLEAVQKDWEYDLINPRTNQPVNKISAREVFDTLVLNAWKTGDPGLIFLERLNEPGSNPTPSLGRITATNPCGEQPLFPNEPCHLGSLNLSLFVKNNSDGPEVEWELLGKTIGLSIRFLDNIIDVNNYPLPEMEFLAKMNRRIGLGVMGWAEMLTKLKIPYDSEKALQLANDLMSFINRTALSESEELAKERGVFPNWKASVYDPEGPYFSGREKRPRHSARTTIAPTGTIGLAAGLQGAGIEPFYAIAYTRYNAKALLSVKNNQVPDPNDVYYEVNPLFRKIAEDNNFFGLPEKELWKKIENNKKSVRGISEIPKEIQDLFATSHDISVEFHVKTQAAFQQFTDNAVSKTINLPHQASVADVKNAFLLAHQLGCKGITVYRDGSKQQQVLNFFSGPKKLKRARDLSLGVSSEYYEIKTGHGPLHLHIDYDDNGPFRIFASLSPLGTEISGLTAIAGILLSKYLEEGGDPNKILRHLQSIKGDRPFGLGDNRIFSIPHAISVALKNHLQKHGWLDLSKEDGNNLFSPSWNWNDKEAPNTLELWSLAQVNEQCPECFSTNIRFSAGCSGPVCHDCGYSECT